MAGKSSPLGAIGILVLLAIALSFWWIWLTAGAIYLGIKFVLQYLNLKRARAELTALNQLLPAGTGYVVFDFETSGLYPADGERVVQLGAMLLDEQLFEVGRFQTIFNPQHVVGPTEIHGITQRMTANQPKFRQLAPQLFELFNNRTVIAHNVEFDAGFLISEFSRTKFATPVISKIDTLELARDLLPNSPNHKLATVVNQLNIDVTHSPGRGNHDAITDTWYVWQIFLAMVEKGKLNPKKLAYS